MVSKFRAVRDGAEPAKSAGEAFFDECSKSPEAMEALAHAQNKIRGFFRAFAAGVEAIQDHPATKARADHEAELQRVRDDCIAEAQAVIDKWEVKYGEPYPAWNIEDLQRWLARADVPGRYLPAEKITAGHWTAGDIFPFIEGHLQKLAEQSSDTEIREQADESKTSDDKSALILAALCVHHGYDGRGILNDEPLGVRELATLTEGKASKSTVQRWFKEKFDGGHRGYKAACVNQSLLSHLRLLAGDFTPRTLRKALKADNL